MLHKLELTNPKLQAFIQNLNDGRIRITRRQFLAEKTSPKVYDYKTPEGQTKKMRASPNFRQVDPNNSVDAELINLCRALYHLEKVTLGQPLQNWIFAQQEADSRYMEPDEYHKALKRQLDRGTISGNESERAKIHCEWIELGISTVEPNMEKIRQLKALLIKDAAERRTVRDSAEEDQRIADIKDTARQEHLARLEVEQEMSAPASAPEVQTPVVSETVVSDVAAVLAVTDDQPDDVEGGFPGGVDDEEETETAPPPKKKSRGRPKKKKGAKETAAVK